MRKKGPALYELIRDRHRAETYTAPARDTGPRPGADDRDPDTRGAHWFSPGRTVRVPMGYFFFGIGLMLVIAWLAYFVGYKHAERVWEQRARLTATEEFNGLRDPLDVDLNRNLLRPPEGSQPVQTPDIDGPGEVAAAPGTTPNREVRPGIHLVEAWGEPGDPRQPGMYYFQLMTSENVEEVMRAADFVAGNALEVAVIRLRSNNTRPSYVLRVLKPFPAAPETTAEGRQFRERLLQLGREYKRDHQGVDFNSMIAYQF